MSKDDIEKAVKEAERYAEEDKQRREEIDTRNNADQLVYQCEKVISEEGEKFPEADKKELQEKVDALKEALKSQDLNVIKSRQEELTKKFYEISEQLYKAAQPEAGAQGPETAGGQQAGPDANGYYEANYTDVTDDDSNK